MKVKLIFQNTSILAINLFLIVGIGFAQDHEADSPVFVSSTIGQWDTQGNVFPDSSDGSLYFVFPYDDEHQGIDSQPDTILIMIKDPISLRNCSTAFVRYRKENILPNDESWVLTNIRVEARHEHRANWFRVYENLSEFAGWVDELRLRIKIVVHTDRVYPGTFKLHDIRVEGSCG